MDKKFLKFSGLLFAAVVVVEKSIQLITGNYIDSSAYLLCSVIAMSASVICDTIDNNK